MPQLDFATYPFQLLWLIISFFTLYGLLRYIFIPGIEKRMVDRIVVIKQNIDHADSMLKEVLAIKNRTNARLQEARDEAKSIVMRSENDIKTLVETKNKEIEKACAVLYVNGEKEAEKCRQQLLTDVPNLVSMLKAEVIQKFDIDNKIKYKA
jgi:F-type H+-transporting ATPase subunit b